MKNLIKSLLLISATVSLLYRCASVAPPTGGDKDVEPPLIISSIPLQKTTNYHGKIIEMVFNENITIENIKQELLITPRIEGNYEYEVKKNRLSIKFPNDFEANTTYTLNFRKAIRDITEKNIAENQKVVFSTGNTIDSLYINGTVKDILTNKSIENALVMLYLADDTSTILKHPPYYLTKTDKQGKYLLENIREGKFNIYALADNNSNLKYDLGKEQIAFLKELIQLTSNIDSLEFTLTRIDNEKPKIIRSGVQAENYVIELNEGLISADVKADNNRVYYQIDKNKQVILYNTFNTTDSIPLQITVEDSARNILQTDIKVKFNTPGKSKTKPKPFTVETQPKNGEKITGNLFYKISFSKPVQNFSLSQIQLLADTITAIPLDEKNDFSWNNSYTQLTLKKQIGNSKITRMFIPSETFFSVESDTNKSIITNHELKDIEQYGTISGEIKTTEKNFIIQLLNSNYDVVDERINTYKYRLDYLEAGTYFIRVILDSNGNGRWDQGNFQEKILPEKIFFIKNEIPLKQNWEQEGQDLTF